MVSLLTFSLFVALCLFYHSTNGLQTQTAERRRTKHLLEPRSSVSCFWRLPLFFFSFPTLQSKLERTNNQNQSLQTAQVSDSDLGPLRLPLLSQSFNDQLFPFRAERVLISSGQCPLYSSCLPTKPEQEPSELMNSIADARAGSEMTQLFRNEDLLQQRLSPKQDFILCQSEQP